MIFLPSCYPPIQKYCHPIWDSMTDNDGLSSSDLSLYQPLRPSMIIKSFSVCACCNHDCNFWFWTASRCGQQWIWGLSFTGFTHLGQSVIEWNFHSPYFPMTKVTRNKFDSSLVLPLWDSLEEMVHNFPSNSCSYFFTHWSLGLPILNCPGATDISLQSFITLLIMLMQVLIAQRDEIVYTQWS